MMMKETIAAEESIPIYVIGAGGIVNTAHLPAYRLAGYRVAGIFDLDSQKATATAATHGIAKTFATLNELLSDLPAKAVLDIAVPAAELETLLQQFPIGSFALLQKPMGEDLAAAKRILRILKDRKITAAVNFQLRYAAFIREVRSMMDKDLLGEVHDIEINVNVYTPWQLWDFLYSAPRVEIVYHSIHYIDLVRSFFGNPASVFARTSKHPGMTELASVRSNIIMDYGEWRRANILTNHGHGFGPGQEQSYIKFEGTKGAVKIDIGALRNYPTGGPDRFQYTLLKEGSYTEWQTKQLEGSWFPHAFAGSMQQLLLTAAGRLSHPDNSAEDALHTMACVEAAYLSSAAGGVRPGPLLENE